MAYLQPTLASLAGAAAGASAQSLMQLQQALQQQAMLQQTVLAVQALWHEVPDHTTGQSVWVNVVTRETLPQSPLLQLIALLHGLHASGLLPLQMQRQDGSAPQGAAAAQQQAQVAAVQAQQQQQLQQQLAQNQQAQAKADGRAQAQTDAQQAAVDAPQQVPKPQEGAAAPAAAMPAAADAQGPTPPSLAQVHTASHAEVEARAQSLTRALEAETQEQAQSGATEVVVPPKPAGKLVVAIVDRQAEPEEATGVGAGTGADGGVSRPEAETANGATGGADEPAQQAALTAKTEAVVGAPAAMEEDTPVGGEFAAIEAAP